MRRHAPLPLSLLPAFRMAPGVSDGARLFNLILDALKQPCSTASSLDQIVAAMAGRPWLLLLDNADHLPGESILPLLERLPNLVCLVTSRQLLEIDGECAFPVAPLPAPTGALTPEQLMEFACARMFVDRAQAVAPDFQITSRTSGAISAICRQLEGLPLAIELAAAKISLCSPTQMRAQLERRLEFLVGRKRNQTERHHSLQATIAWSYERLSAEQQRYFARLSVFRGGWTLEAANEICDFWSAATDSDSFRGKNLMDQLLHRSLLMVEPQGEIMRFRMLETVHEFAAEQLSESEREEVSRRHAKYFLQLAEEAWPYLRGTDRLPWLDRLEVEQENFTAALEWGGANETGLLLAGALWPFWMWRGRYWEGCHRLERAVSQNPEAGPAALAKALHGIGVLARYQGDLSTARQAL